MALISVLAVLALISGMVVALVIGMRVEQQSSHYYLERQRAVFLSQEGTAYGQALIETAIGGTNQSWWSSGPGSLTFLSSTNGNLSSLTNVALSTGAGDTNQGGSFAPANLNPANWLSNEHTLDPYGTNLFLSWIYVRANGSFDTNQAAAALTNNVSPLVGRFAFWVDDESAHINLNTAWGSSGNTNASSHPSQVALTAFSGLTQTMADEIHNASVTRPFNTPFEALSVSGGASAALASNLFEVTHFSHDCDLTPWGTPKITLTTQTANLSDPSEPYIHILATPNTDPGSIANIDPTALQNTLSNIVSQLSQTNWPYVAGSTNLVGKYYTGTSTNRAWQLALDIVEYVRGKESTNLFVEPITGVAGNFSTNAVTYQGNGFYGTCRRPMITEMAGTVVKSTTFHPPGYQYYQMTVYCGFWLPTNTIVPLSTLTNYYFGCQVLTTQPNSGVENGGVNTKATIVDEGVNGDGHFYRASYGNIAYTNAIGAADPTNCYVHMVMQSQLSGGPRGDMAPLFFGTTNAEINLPISAVASASVLPVASMRAADPRVNKRLQDWVVGTPSWTNLITPTDLGPTARQDRAGAGSSGALSTRISLPAPKGTTGNPLGLVTSVGELGYVSTGVECATNTTLTDVAYRTFRFQPTAGASTNTVPDWALADIFCVPVPTNSGTIYRPYPSTVAGRINLNTSLQPFSGLSRTNALDAAFSGILVPTATVSNITHMILAANGVAYGGTNGLVSVGQLSEISGVSDSGEASEDLYRSLTACPVTTRGDVFTIYALGQALKQTPNGTLIITGQKETRTMLERYPTTVVSGGTTNSLGLFRSILWREE